MTNLKQIALTGLILLTFGLSGYDCGSSSNNLSKPQDNKPKIRFPKDCIGYGEVKSLSHDSEINESILVCKNSGNLDSVYLKHGNVHSPLPWVEYKLIRGIQNEKI